MRLIIDLDEVIVSFLPELIKRYNRQTCNEIMLDDITEWSMSKFPEAHKIYKEEGFFRDLLPIQGAVWGMRELWDAGHDLIIATDAQYIVNIIEDKLHWVRHYLPFLQKENVVFISRKELLRGDLIFDDAPHHLTTFPGITVAMDRPYNRHINTEYRVNGWGAFIHLIKYLEMRK